MEIPTWGSSPKAQDDPQTINEAINLAIANHESDPTAHLGDGESLEQHKSNEVIDHPASSVLADKITKDNVILETNFNSLGNISKTGTANLGTLDGVVLNVAPGGSSASNLIIESTYFDDLFDYSKRIYFETRARFTEGVSVNGTIGLLSGFATNSNGFGFQIRAGVLYAYSGYSSAHVEANLSSISIYTQHFYSAQYDPATGYVYFYVDGNLVATLTTSYPTHWYTTDSKIVSISIVSATEENIAVKYFYITKNDI
jgi:hypothetical protein